MISRIDEGVEQQISGRTWQFRGCEFDEYSRELRVGGKLADVEAKPLEVLYQLLQRAGEVVTKEELLEAVWPGVRVVDGSLATAVSKLRKALADDDAPVILTVPRIGYRLGVPVQCRIVAPAPFAPLGFAPGDTVPGRTQWQLIRNLDTSHSSEVWLARHPKTNEQRVFKFAADGIRLRGLKREVTLARYLKAALGERPDLVRVLEWNFETAPFYLESEYSGLNLAEWSEAQGGLGALSREQRLAMLVQIAQVVAAAHEVGVLHQDLKPANVLVDEHGQVKLADFGSGSLAEPVRLQALGITNLGFTRTETGALQALTGTFMYLAPEVLAGQTPTASGDVYALGVMLYQMVVGDFRRPLSPGWEAEVDDPLLRLDIAAAACGDAQHRLPGALAYAERLQTLPQRRRARVEGENERERALRAEAKLARARTRRPWAIAAGVMLAGGLLVSLALYRQAAQDRDRANRQTAIASSMNRFLADDLLGRGNPFQSGTSGETLVAAVKQAAAGIDRQFSGAPEIAARLHQAIARALDNRTDYPDARHEYERAAALFQQTGGLLSPDLALVQLQRAAMEARTYEQGSLPRAKALLSEQEARLAGRGDPRGELRVWLESARGMVALIENRAKPAADRFEAAHAAALKLPTFDESARLTLKQRLAFAYIRLGDGAKAEALLQELIADFSRAQGPASPSALRVRLNLAQAFMIQGKHQEAIEQTSRIYPAYVAKLGEEHELSMQVLTTQAQSEGSLGLWEAAIRDDLKIHEIAVRKQGPLSFFAIATLSDAALAQCRAGRHTEGEPNARRAYEASVKAFGARAGLTGGTAYTAASCAIGLGQLDRAVPLLDGIDVKAVAQLAGIPEWGANVELARAEIAYRRGDLTEARRLLAVAGPVFARPDAEPYQRQAVATLKAAIAKRAQ